MQDIMLFLLGEEVRPGKMVKHTSLWHVAWITRSQGKMEPIPEFVPMLDWNPDFLHGAHPWKVVDEKYEDYYWEGNQRKTKWAYRKRLRIELQDRVLPNRPSKGLFSWFKSSVAPSSRVSLYASQILKAKWIGSEENDVQRLLSLVPNNPGALLMGLSQKLFRYPGFQSEAEKRILIRLLEYMAQIQQPLGEVNNTFLAFCMIAAEKIPRTMAAEVWNQQLGSDLLDNHLIGRVIGKICGAEFVVIKRLTDLLQPLFNLSGLHKRSTHDLVASCLMELPKQPLRSLKKLLTIYQETQYNFKEPLPFELSERLREWEKTKSLQAVVKAIYARGQA